MAVLIWVGLVFVPKVNPSPTGFTVITFNMGAKHAIMGNVDEWLKTAPADVVLAQETFNYRLQPGIEHLRAVYPYQAIQKNEIGYRSNSTLSVYPILADGQEGFEPDSTFTRVVINYKGALIAVYNVKLLAPFRSVSQPLSIMCGSHTRNLNSVPMPCAMPTICVSCYLCLNALSKHGPKT